MSLTPSNMVPLGNLMPDFLLLDVVNNKYLGSQEFAKAQCLVVMFICNHCPYVLHLQSQIVVIAHKYLQQNIAFVAISANDVTSHPDDAPEKMREMALRVGYPFPYLYDETQEVARAFDAACTPDFYLYNRQRQLVYRGQFDDARPGNQRPVTGKDLANALDQLVKGGDISPIQVPSSGCNIKWKKS